MRVLAYEFITGGGAAGSTIPEELAGAGESMLGSLLAELRDVEGVQAVTTRDARLGRPPWAAETVFTRPGESSLAHFARAMHAVDAVWPIAPETDGVLAELTELIIAHDKVLLGSSPDALRIASSKWRTSQRLREAGVAVVPTFAEAAQIPDGPGSWVVKPDGGAGCIDTFRLPDGDAARARLGADAMRGIVAQPWIDGDALSLSLLCRDRGARVLACNRQHLGERSGRLKLRGVSVGARPIDAALRNLAQGVVSAVPGLWGYVGVDIVYGEQGPVVIEINPRLTTSYCRLGAHLGRSVAADVLGPLRRNTRYRDVIGTCAARDIALLPQSKEVHHAA